MNVITGMDAEQAAEIDELIVEFNQEVGLF